MAAKLITIEYKDIKGEIHTPYVICLEKIVKNNLERTFIVLMEDIHQDIQAILSLAEKNETIIHKEYHNSDIMEDIFGSFEEECIDFIAKTGVYWDDVRIVTIEGGFIYFNDKYRYNQIEQALMHLINDKYYGLDKLQNPDIKDEEIINLLDKGQFSQKDLEYIFNKNHCVKKVYDTITLNKDLDVKNSL